MPIRSPHQVVVVGAGLAGLVAARRRAADGSNVVVLEARDRVGGRVWSPRLPNGEVVELGGEWISISQTPVIRLARELGLGLADTGMDFTSRDPVGGPPIAPEEHHRLAARLEARQTELGPETLEEISAEDLLDSLGESGLAMSVLRSRLAGTAGASLENVAAAEIGDVFGIGDQTDYVRIEGGNDLLARIMARDLEVRLDETVTSIHQSDQTVEVVVRNEVLDADAMVLAVPLAVLQRMVFDPVPGDDLLEALESIPMGTGMKVAVATKDDPPMFRRQDLDIPAWYWTGLGPNGVRRAITGFAGSAPGVEALAAEPRQRLARSAPEVTLMGEPLVADWGSDVFAGGCYSVIGPGRRRLLHGLSRPWGRVVLAGEHVNGSGTIEGAIRSGEEAARLVAGLFRS
jgi:monoamine oxidase